MAANKQQEPTSQERIYDLATEMKGGSSRLSADDIKKAADKLRTGKNPHSDNLFKNLSDKDKVTLRMAPLDTVSLLKTKKTKVNPVDRAKGGLMSKKKKCKEIKKIK